LWDGGDEAGSCWSCWSCGLGIPGIKRDLTVCQCVAEEERSGFPLLDGGVSMTRGAFGTAQDGGAAIRLQ
jgi:hypothetical protein